MLAVKDLPLGRTLMMMMTVEDGMNETIDNVDLPPDCVGEISDCEDIDEDVLDDKLPAEVSSDLEIQTIREQAFQL